MIDPGGLECNYQPIFSFPFLPKQVTFLSKEMKLEFSVTEIKGDDKSGALLW